MVKSGWVFRIEIITEKPATKTTEIVKEISKQLSESPLISQILIEELYEEIKLFKEREEETEKT